MFEAIETRGVDNLLALMQKFRADPRQNKVDLVVGVYKNDAGDVPVMRAVKAAEHRLWEAEDSKNYVGIVGDAHYRALVPSILLGPDAPQVKDGRITSVQTPGGTGALKVACDFLNKLEAGKRFWVSTPTWANHIPVATDAGLSVENYPYFRPSDRGLDFDAMMTHLEKHAQSGDALLLHACCHNPTGVDLSFEQWKIVTDFVVARGVLPLVDCAYQGLADGMDDDVAGLRHMAASVPEMLIASSFSKNFGIYRERTGALSVLAQSSAHLSQAMEAVESAIRSNYSMPPSHGARIVATVLSDDDLSKDWALELTEMRARIASMRHALCAKLKQRDMPVDPSFLTEQRGMFSYTGLTPAMVKKLKEDHGIYTAGDGRVNMAGLSNASLDAVADGFAQVFRNLG